MRTHGVQGIHGCLIRVSVWGHGKKWAGKTGWGKLMMSCEYHPKTGLFHEGKEEILKE